jgi:hypothetical protein
MDKDFHLEGTGRWGIILEIVNYDEFFWLCTVRVFKTFYEI